MIFWFNFQRSENTTKIVIKLFNNNAVNKDICYNNNTNIYAIHLSIRNNYTADAPFQVKQMM